MTLSLRGVRTLARNYNYEEINCNEESCVISFRGGPAQSTRINVYYTTGTVGSCLNHPRRGKTQLFRRNISTLDLLENIFENPRAHTGEGYYTRKSIHQQWKNTQTDEFYVDSARRWVYVGAATGLVKNERERNTITEICTKWDTISWNRDSLPSATHTRHSCGTSGLERVLFEVMQDTYGDFLLYNSTVVNNYWEQMSAGDCVEKPLPCERSCCGAGCEDFQAFLEAHSGDVVALQRLFMSLRKIIRLELAAWFLSRNTQDLNFTNLDVKPFHAQSNYHEALHFAHIEYGELNYPRNKGMCNHCGVLKNKSPLLAK
eukprot:CAMPEP_0170909282 /NCGR_PEP_ID=MMETSP0735-20130129/2425_1 /TAXON_ID=186038 /ORGANISM="Fragilariopsis kerguelensis, Strain L26-C5" /LENGTH=316 /DNA_ID=CAMNT_0011305801 /DNA_START=82 /DNA_END=1030 /DNA_ORIENTATION=-